MKISEQFDLLLPALVEVQDRVEVKKSKDNPFHKSKYADLEAIHAAAFPVLKELGLVVVQAFDDEGIDPGQIKIITRVFHIESGQWVESRFRLDAKGATPQDMGSAATYARRYSLLTVLGLCPEDDDAESAQRSYRQGGSQQGKTQPTTQTRPAETPLALAEETPLARARREAKEKGIQV